MIVMISGFTNIMNMYCNMSADDGVWLVIVLWYNYIMTNQREIEITPN